MDHRAQTEFRGDISNQEEVVSSNDAVLQWRIQDFSKEGVPTPRGAPTYDFAEFSQKLHEIERIWTGGARIIRAPP